MSNYNSKLILAKNILLDKTHKNVLNYSTNDMLALLRSQGHLVGEASNYSFIQNGKISVGFTYNQCLTSNYIAYQNPNYSSKWFFAFIDRVEYESNKSTIIYYTIDNWATWFDNLNLKQCFVVREHVNDDRVGLHTLPENVELGEYICNSHTKDTTMDSYANDLCYILASTYETLVTPGDDDDDDPRHNQNYIDTVGSHKYNGIYTGLAYYYFDTAGGIDFILELYAKYGVLDGINGIFMSPKWLAPYQLTTQGNIVTDSNTPATFNTSTAKQTTLNGYTPVNKKLLTFPYNYLLLSNNIGQNAILHYEKFSDTSNCTFTVKGVINPGCSINITPTNYNGSASSDIDAIQLGKFPICNFQNDMYTNWLTQNSVNILGATITNDDINMASSVIGGIAGMITGAKTGNVLGAGLSAISGAQGIAGAIMQKKQHNLIPPTVSGSLNSADINVASGNNTFHYYKMSIKQEYARVIDGYFSMYGYQVNSLKVPNITGRASFNYIEIGQGERFAFGEVPPESLTEINMIAQNGLTIWHNHANIGNYNVNNSII